MTLHVSLYMVQGDKILASQSTVIWILYMFLFNIPRMTFHVPEGAGLGASLEALQTQC